jgi:hypothetical protein
MMMAKADLALLRIVASIYSQCHFAEMAKLMATEEQSRQGMAPAMTSLWQAFILRVQMIEVLGSILIPGVADEEKAGTSRSGGGGKSPSVAALKTPSENREKPTSLPRNESISDKSAEGAGGKSGPMSFFVKKNSA